ncbi:MAG: glycosyltransferase [Chthoniobacterales bacterium]|nr:glycosyltransferase [Chthoniobacterales bacterium]
MPEPVQVSFLVPAFNEEILVGRAVRSIRQAAAECGLEVFEILVCDNASTDATADVARAAGARVVLEPHRQIARARNAAAASSSGAWLVWLDADAILTGDVLEGTLEALASGVVCGGGARVELEGEELTLPARCVVRMWNGISRTFRLAAGSYFFALREGWEATGGFNEEVYAGEELGFSTALRRWGRARGLAFRVLDRIVPSSARKVHSFTAWQVVRQLAVCAWPGNRARRDRCGFWYERHSAS